ncbi:inosine/xanthosine triphosphatase [Deinococcus metalli]|uniref:Probable inosine/xanthosine triphosphatase n=1 Tax=Deinococcus metalli TaxID=1141878 RepID=A0A7W8NN69_9DEIO|nr:inosine/xanthosine triphosphatase [Deinococcus metalli]MBB5375411.1 inosine/xanthosine triphosphatase [Deinococcus metalli]GHF29484.1 non-canonical purine NTP phosphatase [Deinococcus metalli]
MSVVVGSRNPAKVGAVREVFHALDPALEVRGSGVPSGVPDQPLGVAQTRSGAVNRARGALRDPGATWGVGLEGGVRFSGDHAWLFGIVAVARPGGALHTSRTAELRLPAVVAARVRAGEELGPVMDDLLGTVSIKTGVGTVGAFTRGLVTRPQVWSQALALAMAPLLTPEVYSVR